MVVCKPMEAHSMHACTHARARMHACMQPHVHIVVCVCVFVSVCVSVCVCVSVRLCLGVCLRSLMWTMSGLVAKFVSSFRGMSMRIRWHVRSHDFQGD